MAENTEELCKCGNPLDVLNKKKTRLVAPCSACRKAQSEADKAAETASKAEKARKVKKNSGPECQVACTSGCRGTTARRPLVVGFSAQREPQPIRGYAGKLACSACAEMLRAARVTVFRARKCAQDDCSEWTAGKHCQPHHEEQVLEAERGKAESAIRRAEKAAEAAGKIPGQAKWALKKARAALVNVSEKGGFRKTLKSFKDAARLANWSVELIEEAGNEGQIGKVANGAQFVEKPDKRFKSGRRVEIHGDPSTNGRKNGRRNGRTDELKPRSAELQELIDNTLENLRERAARES